MIALSICPVLIRWVLSIEKAEKVVKPPKRPVIRSSRHSIDNCHRSESPKRLPIIKQPITLTDKVPNGKMGEVFC